MPAPAVSSNTGVKRYSLRRLIAFTTVNTESPGAAPLVSIPLSPFLTVGLVFLRLDGVFGVAGIGGIGEIRCAVYSLMYAARRFPRTRKSDFQAAEIASARHWQLRKVVYVLTVELYARKQ